MENFFEILITILLGIIEGITEWLPISSTGHLILFKEFITAENSFVNNSDFFDLYLYVIQLGAILAVVTLYFKKLNPFSPSKSAKEKKNTWSMWLKVIIACVPAAVIGLALDSIMESIENAYVVSSMLIVYGIAFIIVEILNKKTNVHSMEQMSYKTALYIGLFQVLSIIPGTSRSVAAEFSFFLAIPVMFGVSFLKITKFILEGSSMDAMQICVLLIGMAIAYATSMLCIKFLVNFVKKHDFKFFGIYRIALGIIVLEFFLIRAFI